MIATIAATAQNCCTVVASPYLTCLNVRIDRGVERIEA